MRSLLIFVAGGAVTALAAYVGVIIYFIRNGNPT